MFSLFNNLLSSRKNSTAGRKSQKSAQRKTRPDHRSRRPQMEHLESREQMAANLTAVFEAGVLKVEGTPNDDRIYLRNEAGKITIDGININSISRGISRTWTAVDVSAITSIEVSGLAGNDIIRMTEAAGTTAIGMTVYGGKGNDNIYGTSVRDTLMGGDKLDSEQTGTLAASLDSQYRFYAASSEWQNYLGQNEKWFKGQTEPWYYIKPSGEIFRSNASGTTAGALLAKVAPAYYNNLSSLLEADSGQAAATVDNSLNLYATGNYYQNLGGRNEKWIMAGTNQKWHFITPDGVLYQQTVSGSATDIGVEVARLDTSYWNDPSKLVNASTLFSDADVIYGYGGGDALLGGGGVDSLLGGIGSDFMYGGAGNDNLLGNEDADYMYGDQGNDTLTGGSGNDELYGGEGNDTARGEVGDDIIWGGDERNAKVYSNDSDWLYGDAGNDEIHGGGGLQDVIYGGENDDLLFGEDGIDFLYGGNGNDTLYGGAGIDYLFGEAGNDGLFGGYTDSLNDTMNGGSGADRFLRPAYKSSSTAYKYDTVSDFATEDAEVCFAYGDKAWTDDEIIQTDKGLAWLHQMTNNTRLLELPSGGTQFVLRNGSLGADIGGNNDGLGTIRMADLGVVNGLAKNMVHEIAHNWQNDAFSAGFMGLSAWQLWNVSGPIPGGFIQATNMGVRQVYAGYDWFYHYSAQFAREYGRTNPNEDFATSLEMVYDLANGTGTNPAANWANKYNFMVKWINGKRT